jgi:hypothetical protein
VKNSLRGAAIAPGIVPHALLHALRGENAAAVFVLCGRQRAGVGEAGLIEHERRGRQARHLAGAFELIGEKILDALIDRTEMLRERTILFATEREQVIDEAGERIPLGQRDAGLADFAQLEVQIREEPRIGGIGHRAQCGGYGRHVGETPTRQNSRTRREQPRKPV